jgi:hypothetical protein
MNSLNSAKSRTKFVLAAAIVSAAMLAFVEVAPAQQAKDTGTVVVMPVCRCAGGCRLVRWCLVNYCYTETVCDACLNCHALRRARIRKGEKLCLYRKGDSCVTHVATYRRL